MGSQTPSSVIDKRLRRPHGESATDFLRDFPALVALSRLAVPVLAVDDKGSIEFANEAFAAMVGYSRQELVTMTVQTLAPCVPALGSGVVEALRAYANTLIRIHHADGWAMPALISDSVLIREDEKLALLAFTDFTEIAWHSSPNDDLVLG